MSDVQTITPSSVPVRRREIRPERLRIGDEEFVRNDVIAREHGTTERSVNRGDAKGAPFIYLYGVKYRPLDQYNAFLSSQVVVRSQAPAYGRSHRK